ncbi:hypothetical protein SERLA73DRAFT_175652 [Serpula lacrymans var. lacrymans S7.3]|uniref:Uncharacterized protein n=1 Tax=Serpula lacrymans var. lacrymans (strain S7.3) TaxID=936435 RepID=F8PL40_SERL3|nr:hypothetical protein SERLA73DRAFT_175652 [Serpula lacrymans var. lacrymans S7.3]
MIMILHQPLLGAQVSESESRSVPTSTIIQKDKSHQFDSDYPPDIPLSQGFISTPNCQLHPSGSNRRPIPQIPIL